MNEPKIILSPQQYEILIGHAIKEVPIECCGLISGTGELAKTIFPIENIANSALRYEMHPGQQIKAMHTMENNGQDLIAIYHSHPRGPHHPSSVDVKEAHYPEASYLIIHQDGSGWQISAYKIIMEQISPCTIMIVQ